MRVSIANCINWDLEDEPFDFYPRDLEFFAKHDEVPVYFNGESCGYARNFKVDHRHLYADIPEMETDKNIEVKIGYNLDDNKEVNQFICLFINEVSDL